jgi:hypothetical protein
MTTATTARSAGARIGRWLRRAALLGAVLAALHLDLGSWDAAVGWLSDRADAGQPLHGIGAPVRVADDARDRVVLLTSQDQLERRRRLGIRTVPAGSQTQLDLWAFDVAAMRPMWRRRVLAGERSALSGHRMLGVDGGRVWLYADGLRAVDLADGARVGGPADLARLNPDVAGLLPSDPDRYGFDARGVHLVDDAARRWRLDSATGRLQPLPAQPQSSPPPRRAGTLAPAWFQANYGNSFKSRGLDLERRWLGLLDADEAGRLAAPPQVPGAKPGDRPGAAAHHYAGLHTPNLIGPLGANRYRLWRAQIVQVSAAPPDWPKSLPDNWGTRDQYRHFAALGLAPEFLDAGLLVAEPGRSPLLLRDPDSVLVLHRDRLGIGGRLQLARVAGPDGALAWNSALPLTLLQAVLPGQRSLVLYGQRHDDAGGPPVAVLVAIDLKSGEVTSFAFDRDGASFAAAGEPDAAL